MAMKTGVCTALAAVLMSGAFAASANATAFLDQITTTAPTAFSASQIFEPAYDAYSIATIDDFTVTGAADVTSVAAIFAGYNGFSDASYSDVGYYSVNVYSSIAAAGISLKGDVASFNIDPSQANVVFEADTDDAIAEVTLPVNIALAAGTYYFGISPQVNFSTDGQIAVGVTDGGNAYQANPGQGFGQGATFPATDPDTGAPVSAEYNINGTYTAVSAAPEPASWALMILGVGGIGFAFRQARKRHGFSLLAPAQV